LYSHGIADGEKNAKDDAGLFHGQQRPRFVLFVAGRVGIVVCTTDRALEPPQIKEKLPAQFIVHPVDSIVGAAAEQ